ncbi:helix-turn-helix domain-containing protein [Mesorhizobium sp. CO1-1-2]|uniref:Crp/Fnr family transcriptional regulator n=1 Tax=Mesorhizobium sp. CO1-1-2 TaxID=2876635 RepID=UPI001CC9CD73|nr:helix-turn-helix domain-containing protein [Mesorhizobium sp. CO1-1-2]
MIAGPYRGLGAWTGIDTTINQADGGVARDNSFDLPLTQQELADTMGMSLVHMNRTLRGLRSRELITTNGRTVTVENLRALMKFAAFDPLYLHQQAHKFRSLMQAKVA